MSTENEVGEFRSISHFNGLLVGFNSSFAVSTHREKGKNLSLMVSSEVL